EDGVDVDHLGRHEIAADAEMFDRALRLRPPQPVGRYGDLTEAVALRAHLRHRHLLLGMNWRAAQRLQGALPLLALEAALMLGVCARHRRSAGMATSPRLSLSVRI